MANADTPATRWLSHDEQLAWRAYLRAHRELQVALDRDLTGSGLSLPEYELLSMLSEQEGDRARMSVLADLVVQSRSRVTHTAKRLEDRGWVRREPTPEDGRGVALSLTAEGRRTIESAAPTHVESVRTHFIDLLSTEQVSALYDMFAVVREHLVPGTRPDDEVR
ncbi:MarR family transcriptional regulator [Knoellia sinensis KCTC 19936]|uniref:MarR family transcriptional regulator n=1 Tax=Knoellia sinensis KCTC 19936 TaxID=1385520 RepID=A0A0A0JE70_9MICO|nr:MarR family transcriptional regulator [Knoellia sinensis]KGN33911.1 MarR family transcriptional regulator [Knoellia sinensis KCTC 19936]